MYNEINKEEKLTKEERDILEKNLRICFDVIVKSTGAKSFDIENDMGNKEKFLKEFSPWHQDKGKKLIEDFEKNVNGDNSNNDFSWLDILDKDRQWEKQDDEKIKKEVKDKSKHVNMRYQIPTHFHGDIDNAVLFYCMENPRGYLGDWKDNQIDKEFAGASLEEFYINSAIKREEKGETIKDIIEERYQLNDVTTDSIEKIIYSDAKEDSPLRRELDNMFDEKPKFFQEEYILQKNKRSKKRVLSEKYYYIARFYAQLLEINSRNLSKYNIESEYKEEAQAERDKAIKISEKICNVEIYPFSSSEPKLEGVGETIFLNSDLSRLGAYIILRRIYRYLDNKAEKPVIIFRKYDSAWKKLFNEIFDKVKEKDSSFDNIMVLSLLEKGFFYCQTGQQGGGITDGNVISVPNFNTVDRKNSKEFKKTKLNDFNSIKSLLTKVEM